MTPANERVPPSGEVIQFAAWLHEAWMKYTVLFGAEPHGTVKQLAALIELCPQAREAIRLFEKQREERMTV